jgi:drug/metabolite transporter (DMT)-like permease
LSSDLLRGGGSAGAGLRLFASMALVGSYVALLKPLTAQVPVFALAFLRFAIAAVVLLPWTRRLARAPAATRGESAQLFLQSFFGNFLFSVCMLLGLSMTSAMAAGVVLSTLPVTVAILSWALLAEAFTPRLFLSVICAGAGIGLLQAAGSSSGASLLGSALVMGGVVCEALYVVIGKRLVSSLAPLRICASINLWGLALSAPMGLWQLARLDIAALPAGRWLLLGYYAIAASILAPWLWMSGLRSVRAGQAGAFTVALPLTATAIAVGVLGETAGWRHALALGFALLAIRLSAEPAVAPALAPDRSQPR